MIPLLYLLIELTFILNKMQGSLITRDRERLGKTIGKTIKKDLEGQ